MLNMIKVITIDVSNWHLWLHGNNAEMGVEFDQPFPEIKDFNDERAYGIVKPGEYAEILILAMSSLVLVLTS